MTNDNFIKSQYACWYQRIYMTVTKTSETILSEVDLITQCQNELPYNTTSYEILVKQYRHIIFAYCLRMTSNPDDADEITQDVFVKVFQHITSFAGRSSFKTWLFSIAHNQCMTHFGKAKRWRENNDSYAAEQSLDTQEQTIGVDENQLITQVLMKMSDLEREILTLRHVNDFSFQEAADTLAISLSAAKMRYSRASNHFREIYQQLSD